jgi:predicted kinase
MTREQGSLTMKEPFVAYVRNQLAGQPVLMACGLPATNKTETMEVVARVHGYSMLRSDMLRLEVLANEDIFDEKVAANMDKRTLVYDEMFRRAHEMAARGEGVILDATFVTQALRRRAAEVAAGAGRQLVIQQTRCSEEYSLAKISRRSRENYESNALTSQAYYNNVKKFEPVDLDDLKSRHPELEIVHMVVDTESNDEHDWYVVERVER